MTTAGEASDALLVQRVLDGDRAAFAQVYERYADRLYDFAVGMLRSRDDAADAVADSFVTMADKLGQLRDADRLRPWLYAVVRRECLRRLDARTKVSYADDDQLGAIPDAAPLPEEQAESAALRELVWAAAEGLNERDRALLDLHLRHGLEGQELADAMGITAGNAYTSVNRLKSQLERSLGALLVARQGNPDCRELGVVLDGWDGRFSVLMRKRVARHVDQCLACDRQRALLAPLGVASALPFLSAPDELRDRVLGDVRLVGHATGPGPSGPPGAAGGPAEARRRRTSRVLSVLAALLVVAALAVIALLDRPDATPLARDAVVSPSPTPTAAPAAQDTTDAVTLAPAPSSAVASPAATTATPSPTTPAPTSPATPPTTAPTSPPTTTGPVAGTVVVTPALLDLGEQARSGTVTFANPGELPVDWTTSSAQPWVVVPPSGSLAADESAPVTVFVDRRSAPAGTTDVPVTVSWDGGSTTFTVRVTQPQPIG